MPTEGKRLLIVNARLYLPTMEAAQGWLLVQGTSIAALGFGMAPDGSAARRVDARGLNLLPGFIDLHVHGAVGREVMDADPAGLGEMALFYARHGVTAFLATTWTDTRRRINAALRAVSQAAGRIPGGATLLGAHLEGPYFNPARCGAQEIALIRRAEREEALEFLDSGVIAGSVLTMETALKNALQASGRPLEQAWPISSLNAAREIGVSARKGSLETGKDADLVLMDDNFQVRMTIVEGEIAFDDYS